MMDVAGKRLFLLLICSRVLHSIEEYRFSLRDMPAHAARLLRCVSPA